MTEIKVLKKNGSELTCKIDTSDLNRVKEFGPWFAEWHKDFNNYLVQTLVKTNVNGKVKYIKKSIQTVVLDVNPQTPIKHLNGDTLDNRKSNLELYNRTLKNDCEKVDHETMAVILRDKFGNPKHKALISMSDVNRVVKDGYNWVVYYKGSEMMVVANTKDGRIRLDEYLMKPEEGSKIHHINLNPLDNRRNNLEIKED